MVKIDIGKKEVLAFVFILSIAFVLGVTEWTDKPVSHEANMVKVTIQGKDYGLQDALDDGLIGGSGSIPCNWVGWKGSLTMTIHEGGKYPSTYNTTVFNCSGGKIVDIQYIKCTDANNPPYNCGIDCSQ